MPESSAAVKHRAKNFYGRSPPSLPSCKTELDILIERHQFIRDSEEQNLCWEDALAKKTYDQLFKEFAVCDLSRWKEAKVAMRWRTSSEVIEGKGHFTCSNLRCKYHEPSKVEVPERRGLGRIRVGDEGPMRGEFADQASFIPLDEMAEEGASSWPASRQPRLVLQELQTSFGYLEHGERKLAQVKLKLCNRCARKMNSCSLSRRRQSHAHDRRQQNPAQVSLKRELPQSLDPDSPHPNGIHDGRPVKFRRIASR